MTESMVELVRVTKTYPQDVVALAEVSLSVAKGEMIFLTGMSGAGKTTLMKLICGIEHPDKGLVEVAGKDLQQIKPREIPYLRQRIGMAYQDFKLLPDRTVAQNVSMAMEVSYEHSRAIKNRVADLLKMLGLEHKHDSPTDKLSRGEQQRVAIARALANYPTLVLADEPTGNLDRTNTEKVMHLFEQYNKAGTTIIIATHHENIFNNTDHRVLELSGGKLSSEKHQPQLFD